MSKTTKGKNSNTYYKTRYYGDGSYPLYHSLPYNLPIKSSKNNDYSNVNNNRNNFMINLPFPKKTLHQIVEAKKRYNKSKSHLYNLLHNLPFPIKENPEIVKIRKEYKINNNKEKSFRQNILYMFSDNIETFKLINFSKLVIKILNMLNNNQGIILRGKIYEKNKNNEKQLKIPNYQSSFSNINQFLKYLQDIQEKSDTDSWHFDGDLIKTDHDKFNTINKSKRGMGINNHFTINEYKGKFCYIPSEDKCFIKCYNYLMNHNVDESLKIEKEFENFLFNTQSKNRKGVMCNAKISKFNEHFKTNVQYYNEKDRHRYPRNINYPNKEGQKEMSFYLHFNSTYLSDTTEEEKTSSGHYCLIDKKNQTKGITEIEDNYIMNWKNINDNVCKVALHHTNTSTNKNYQTYIWDLETHPHINSNGEKINRPYVCACMNLNKFKSIIKAT